MRQEEKLSQGEQAECGLLWQVGCSRLNLWQRQGGSLSVGAVVREWAAAENIEQVTDLPAVPGAHERNVNKQKQNGRAVRLHA